MPKVMTPEEREAFLAGVHVGVLRVSAGDDRGPLATPLWYRYEPGRSVRFMTLPEVVPALVEVEVAVPASSPAFW